MDSGYNMVEPERCQKPRTTYCMIPFICNPEKAKLCRLKMDDCLKTSTTPSNTAYEKREHEWMAAK